MGSTSCRVESGLFPVISSKVCHTCALLKKRVSSRAALSDRMGITS